jgi:hypothetical protein
MSFADLIKENGWYIALAVMLVERVFPTLWRFFTDKIFPVRAKERARKQEETENIARSQREAEATLLKAKIEREVREEEYRRRVEERMVEAQEKTSESINEMTKAITLLGERIQNANTKIDQLDDFTRGAVGDMRERVAKLSPRDTHPKVKRRTRVTAPQ